MRARTARHYLTLLTAALLLCGCGGKAGVTLYVPDGDGLRTQSARVAHDPRALIAALTEAGALPEAEGTYLYCACGTEDYELHGETAARRIVRLDIADGLGAALAALPDERPAVQALVNTFLDYYEAELLVLTVEGVNLETLRANYTHGIGFDEYAKTREG